MEGYPLRDYFWSTLLAYTRFEFDEVINIRQIKPAAREHVDETHPKHWSRAFFLDDLPYNINQNNFTESFNMMIIEARSLPICDMLEWIQRKLMSNMQSSCSKKWNENVGPKILQILDERANKTEFLRF